MYFSCGPLADRFTTNPATSILNSSFSLGRGWLPKQSPHITNIAIVERENFTTKFLPVSRHGLNRESRTGKSRGSRLNSESFDSLAAARLRPLGFTHRCRSCSRHLTADYAD